jgi:putative transcriptional regulator|tara:strand:- start:205 stop:498 length:294 start_codon:yes stop_codon:yes gene_type:complete
MDDAIFNDLLKSTKDMVKHARGEAIQGVTVTELPEVDIKQVRERVGVSQAVFAALIGVSRRTLENWEQSRVSPSGPARALLKILDADPEGAMKVLHS